MRGIDNPFTVLDAEIVRFKSDGSPVWQPIIIERWNDGRSSFTRPALYLPTWDDAIEAAIHYRQNPTRVL